MSTQLRLFILLLAVSTAVAAVLKLWDNIAMAFAQLNLMWVGASLLVLVVYQVWNAWVWGAILRVLGNQISFVQGARMWIEAESCRWLPGGIVWGCGSRVLSAPDYGVKKSLTGKAMVIELTVTVAAWATTTLFIFGTHLPSLFLNQVSSSFQSFPLLVPIVVLTLMLSGFAVIRWKQWFVDKCSIIEEVTQLILFVAPRVYLKYVVLCVLNGLGLYLLSRALPGATGPVYMYIGVVSLAWLCGFFAVGVPSGIGVREAVMVFAFSVYFPMDQAIALAVSWRMLQILAELATLGLSLSWNWISHRQKFFISHV